MQMQKMGMSRSTNIITDCRQTGGDADGDNIVGIGTMVVGMGREWG